MLPMEEEITIKKWLNGELSPQEKETFENSDDGVFYQAIIKTAGRFKVSATSAMPDFQAFEKTKLNDTSLKKPSQSLLPWISGIAAAALLTFGIYSWFSDSLTIIETSIAQTEKITLPDTSEVILNAVSQISFSKNSWSDKRIVNLEGEAFFDVAKGARFNVQTSEGIISVLGTKFNVRQRGSVLEVVCYEGRVQVVSGDISEIITAGQEISKRGGELVRRTTGESQPSWRDEISRFQNTPFAEVVQELERQYEIEVILEDIDTTKMFTGAFEHAELDKALQSITDPFGIKYEIKDNGKLIILNVQ